MLGALPDDLLEVVLGMIEAKSDRRACREVCRHWRQITIQWICPVVTVCSHRDGLFGDVSDGRVFALQDLVQSLAVSFVRPKYDCTNHILPLHELWARFPHVQRLSFEGLVEGPRMQDLVSSIPTTVTDLILRSFSVSRTYVSQQQVWCVFPAHLQRFRSFGCWFLNDEHVRPMVNLVSLTVVNCPLSRPFQTGCFPHLTELDCQQCISLQTGCFDGLQNLTRLNCWHCYELGPDSLTPLVNLTELNCGRVHLLVRDSFSTLTNLTSLNCSGCTSLTDGCFDALVRLRTLVCSACAGLRVTPFDRLTALTSLDCRFCPYLVPCFDSLHNLIELRCGGCRELTDGAFDSLVNLRSLECDDCPLLTRRAVQSLPYLESLTPSQLYLQRKQREG